jgi:hypothetical protein
MTELANNESVAEAAVVEPATLDTATEAVEAVEAVETKEDTAVETKDPIEYKDFAIPEGAVIDDDVMTEFKAAITEAGITQDQAQHLIDMSAKMQSKLTENIQAQWDAKRTEWETASRADKEYGGEKFNENLAIASKAYDAFATPELKALLDSTGMGNHPDMIRAFYKAGLLLSEDKVVTADRGTTTQSANDPRSLYPNSNLN